MCIYIYIYFYFYSKQLNYIYLQIHIIFGDDISYIPGDSIFPGEGKQFVRECFTFYMLCDVHVFLLGGLGAIYHLQRSLRMMISSTYFCDVYTGDMTFIANPVLALKFDDSWRIIPGWT